MAAVPVIVSVEDLEKKEEEAFRTGPLSVLTSSVKTNAKVGGCFLLYEITFGLNTWILIVVVEHGRNRGNGERQKKMFFLPSLPPSLPPSPPLPLTKTH